MEIPNLAGVIAPEDVKKKGGGFAADYVCWATTLQKIREHAPGWMPAYVASKENLPDEGMAHYAPDGSAYLLIYWRGPGGEITEPIPHAVMDNRNRSIPREKISSRDLSDSFVRGVCKSAAATFGFAYELWARIEISESEKPEEKKPENDVADIVAKVMDAEKRTDKSVEIEKIMKRAFEKDGKKFTRYSITSKAGVKYSTFEMDHAVVAKEAKEREGLVDVSLEKRGKDWVVTSISDSPASSALSADTTGEPPF